MPQWCKFVQHLCTLSFRCSYFFSIWVCFKDQLTFKWISNCDREGFLNALKSVLLLFTFFLQCHLSGLIPMIPFPRSCLSVCLSVCPFQIFLSPPVVLPSFISRFALVRYQIDSNTSGSQKKIWSRLEVEEREKGSETWKCNETDT